MQNEIIMENDKELDNLVEKSEELSETEDTVEKPEIEFQTHSSGTKYYIIPLTNQETKEKVELRIFQSYNPGRLEFETRDEYVVRRKFQQHADKQKKKGLLFWDSRLGPMTPKNALNFLETIDKKSKT